MLMSKYLYYRDENCTVSIQPVNDVVHLHCIVVEWKLSTLKKLYIIFSQLQKDMAYYGFKYLVTVTPNPRFAKLFGGESIEEKEIDGVLHEVIVWEL